MRNLIKCHTSFSIGLFTAFTVMMILSGFVITTEFVSKESLKTRIVYIDGKTYKVEVL
jgi:hypothetical protein